MARDGPVVDRRSDKDRSRRVKNPATVAMRKAATQQFPDDVAGERVALYPHSRRAMEQAKRRSAATTWHDRQIPKLLTKSRATPQGPLGFEIRCPSRLQKRSPWRSTSAAVAA